MITANFQEPKFMYSVEREKNPARGLDRKKLNQSRARD